MAKTISEGFFSNVPSTQIIPENLSDDKLTQLIDRVVNPDPNNYPVMFIDGYTADRAELFSRLRTPQSCFKSGKDK